MVNFSFLATNVVFPYGSRVSEQFHQTKVSKNDYQFEITKGSFTFQGISTWKQIEISSENISILKTYYHVSEIGIIQ